MSWPINLSREEILDHIGVFQDAPEFIEFRNTLLSRAVHAKDLQLIECLLKAGAGPD